MVPSSDTSFLGFVVHERGIDVNPAKIQAVIDIQPPRTLKEAQALCGRITALRRFLPRSADKCKHFFKTLRGPAFEWTEECQKSLEELKEVISKPPTLATPHPGEILNLYLAVTEEAVSSVLTKEEDGTEKPIYYVSQLLKGAEIRYSESEKMAYAVLISARKLRPYFQSHIIQVMTNFPLRRVLFQIHTSGRLMAWAIELGEFDIRYVPRRAIKAQCLADFVVECTRAGAEEERQPEETVLTDSLWHAFVDGAASNAVRGAGVYLEGPDGIIIRVATIIQWGCSNNEAEWEAILSGLKTATGVGARRLIIYSDSQLVVGQLTDQFALKEDRMQQYYILAKGMMAKFDDVQVVKIGRSENTKADALSKMTEEELLRNPDIIVQYQGESSINQMTSDIMEIDHEPSWMDEIKHFIITQEVPADKEQAAKLRRKSARFVVMDGELYRRSYTQTWLKLRFLASTPPA